MFSPILTPFKMPKPIATIGCMHTCPMLTGTVPHVGGPIVGPGTPTVLVNNKPVVGVGDMCTCAGPPDSIIQGSPCVFVGGKPAAGMGDMTVHGGVITMGSPNVFIGTSVSTPAPLVMGAGGAMGVAAKQAEEQALDDPEEPNEEVAQAQEKATDKQKQAEKEKKKTEEQEKQVIVSNMKWMKDGTVVNKVRVGDIVKLTASITNADDLEEIPLVICEHDADGNDDLVTGALGIIDGNKVETEWQVIYVPDNDDVDSAKEKQEKGYTLPEYVFKYFKPDGTVVESGIMNVSDDLLIEFKSEDEEEDLSNIEYHLEMPDGSFKTGKLDKEGKAIVEDIFPGEVYSVIFTENDEIINTI